MTEIEKLIDERYNDLSVEERQELYKLYFDPKTTEKIRQDLESIIYYKRPPTAEEFLDASNGWLTENILVSTFDHIKDNLKDILDPINIKNMIVKYGSTRQGKTYEARLIIYYIIIFIHHLREPAMFYGLSPLTRLCIYMISFNYNSTRKLYLEPLFEIMRQSPKCLQILKQDDVRRKQKELGRDTIVWSKAATTGELTLASGLQIQLGNSDPNTIIGSDILACFVSEISFWVEQDGATEEKIFELYTNAYTRIRNTVKQQYLAFVYLDSSANNAESIIEKHIIEELQFKERTHFSWKALWEARPDMAPIWRKTNETFKIITGNGSIPAQLITDEKQLDDIPKDLVMEIPIDFYDDFKTNLIKNIKDIAGRPTQSENKFITDGSLITNIFNNPLLTNIEGALVADASVMPEKQIWNQIYTKFFYKNVHGTYTFKRAPREPRFVGLDLSFSRKGDATGITVLHKELDVENNQIIYVCDLCCAIVGGENGISLDAVSYFILDLQLQGNCYIKKVAVDTFSSENLKQFLERNNIVVEKQSVDRDTTAYNLCYTLLANQQIKAGKNIFLKNNLQGLVVTREGKDKKGKEKIDHVVGTLNNKYFGDWDKSTSGVFAKDVSDSLAQSINIAYADIVIPSTNFKVENNRLSGDKQIINANINDLLKSKNFY